MDGVLPTLAEDVAAINSGSQQFESSARLAGLDPQRAMAFDEQFDTEGESLDLTALGPMRSISTRTAPKRCWPGPAPS